MDVRVKQELVAEYLSNGCSIAQAIDRARVSRTAYNKWREDPEFMALVEQKKNNFVAAACTEVQASWGTLRTKAYNTLLEMLQPDKPDNIRLKAALAVIERDDKQAQNEDNAVTVVFGNVPELGAPTEEAIVDGQDSN